MAQVGAVQSQQQQDKKRKQIQRTITGAANNGAGKIRITCAAHGFSSGNEVKVESVGGTTEANGTWTIAVATAGTFDLIGSTFTNAYTSGGVAKRTS